MFKYYSLMFLYTVMFNKAILALSFCYEDQASFPWVMPNKKGLNIEMMKLLAVKIKEPITFTSLPWVRCLVGLQKGRYDGAFASSYVKKRLVYGYYPTVDGALEGSIDVSKRIHDSEYSLYIRANDNTVTWDGKTLTGASVVATVMGFSIINYLKKLDINVDSRAHSPENVLLKLVNKRINAVALQSSRGDWLIKNNPEFIHKIKKIEPILEKKPYYLMLSKGIVESKPEQAKLIWSTLQKIRESDEYKSIFEKFLHKN